MPASTIIKNSTNNISGAAITGNSLSIVDGVLDVLLGGTLNNPGYVVLPNGLIIQWGSSLASFVSGDCVIPFATTFANGVNTVVCAHATGEINASALISHTYASPYPTTGAWKAKAINAASGVGLTQSLYVNWIAIGH